MLRLQGAVRTPSAASPISGVTVLIVSSDDETIEGTQAYLRRVGASTQSIKSLAAVVDGATNAQAVVLFADDYATESAIETVGALRKKLAAKTVIVVSELVESFASIGAHEPTGTVTVLRRPTWGWMLLDAIRSQLGSGKEDDA